MRHTIDIYDPYDWDELPFWTISSLTGIIAFIGLIVTLVCIGYPGWYWGFSSLVPGLIHLGLMATHAATGLGGSNTNKGKLAITYNSLPRKMKKEISLTREDIKALSAHDAEIMNNKMERAKQYHYTVDTSRINDTNSYLDAYLSVRKELG
jgi:hypothetical protein